MLLCIRWAIGLYLCFSFFFFNYTATTEIYTYGHTLSLHDALPIFDRARRYLSAGQADQAIAEIEAMPGAEVAGEWLMDARRYHEARRALDLIETAAILEPRDSPPAALARKTAVQTP